MAIPTITSISPNIGPSAGGQLVSIHGTNFQTPNVTTLLVDSVGHAFTLVSNILITFTTPGHSVGFGDTQVINGSGSSPLGIQDRYTWVDRAVVAVVSPNVGPAAGGTSVLITGDNFTGATDVQFGGTSVASFTVTDSQHITTTSPAHALGTVDVRVVGVGGISDISPFDHFTYGNPPTVTSVVPAQGDPAGGDIVYVYGTNFDTTPGNTSVDFGGAAGVSVIVYDSGTLGCYSPPHAAGTVNIRVTTTTGGTSAITTDDQYTFLGISITNVNPNSGPTYGGQLVTVTGSGFSTDPFSTYIFIGQALQGQVTVLNSTTLTFETIPQDAGLYDVSVYVKGVYATLPNAYTFNFIIPPQITPTLTPCNLSHLFDSVQLNTLFPPSQPSVTPNTLLSYCDRLPSGRYATVRTAGNSIAAYQTIAAARSLKGLAFFLGDTDDYTSYTPGTPPMTDRRYGIQWSPSNASTAKVWQKHQFMLAQDQLSAAPTGLQIAGSQTFHTQNKLVGGLFLCGSNALSNPAAAAYAIGNIRNILNLDFVLIDITHAAWITPNSYKAALVLFQHVQETYIRSEAGPSLPRVSQHYPTLAVVNPNTTASGLITPDGCFEPTVNGYSGPKTFISPRLPAGSTDIQSAWQWARPINSSGLAMSRCEIMIDCRTSGSAAATATAALDRTTITTGGFTAHVYSGALFFDDLDHLPSDLGPQPQGYWDYDTTTTPNLVQGALIPSYYPDPMPIAQTNHDWATIINSIRQYFTIGFENWKTGHVSAENRPGWITVTDPRCPTTAHTIRSWVRMNGVLMTALGFNTTTFARGLTSPFVQFSGVPVSGDDGPYPFLIEVRRSQNNFDLATAFTFILEVVDPTRIQHAGSDRTSSTGVPIMYPDIAASSPYGSGLHPIFPRAASIARIPGDWGTTADYCRGTVGVTSTVPGQIPSMPLPPRSVGSQGLTDSACGYTYLTDYIQAILDACGSALNNGTPLAICDNPQTTSEYIGFVFAVMASLSNFNTLAVNGTKIGLFQFDTTTGVGAGHSVADLQNPSISINLAQPWLQNAWTSSALIGACYTNPYQNRVTNSYLRFVRDTGIFPSSGPTTPCGTTTTGPTPPNLSNAGLLGSCYQTFYSHISETPTYPGTQPISLNGTPNFINICQALRMAIDAGFSPLGTATPGGSEAETIVEIAIAETEWPQTPAANMLIGPVNIHQIGGPANGILQFDPTVGNLFNIGGVLRDIYVNEANDPATAFRFGHLLYIAQGGSGFGHWATYGIGAPTSHYYLYKDVVQATSPCAEPLYTTGSGTPTLTDAQLAGQLLMLGYTTGTIAQADAAVTSSHIGNVVLFGNGWTSANLPSATAHLQSIAAAANAGIGMLISGNQEGGDYQAFTGAGFATIPSALDQASQSPSTLQTNAALWANQLKAVGINYDLAPVLDVTSGPSAGNASDPTGRTYGYTPGAVSIPSSAFIRGLQSVSVAGAGKHFPGTGRITGNTDITTVGIDDPVFSGASDPNLAPFSSAISTGVLSIMVGNAYYSNFSGASVPAFSSPQIITTLLRGSLGFNGVVISDDIGAAVPAVQAYPSPGARALAFLDAGGDLILTVQPSDAVAMSNAIVARMGSDPAFKTRVQASVNRILQLKQQVGVPGASGTQNTSFLGCPAPNTCLSADCDWHLRNEGLMAVDLASTNGSEGQPLFATCSGVVIYYGWTDPAHQGNNNPLGHYGIETRIQCDSNTYNGVGPMYTRYGHMTQASLFSPITPSVGNHVIQGQLIGYMGQTGYATGPHVHYEVNVGGIGNAFTVCPNGDPTTAHISPGPSPAGPNLLGTGCIASLCS